MSVSFTVVNPRGEIKAKPFQPPSRRLDGLNGKTIGLYSNGKPGMDNVYTVLEEMLKAKYPDIGIVKLTGAFLVRDDEAKEFAQQVDGFVYGGGD